MPGVRECRGCRGVVSAVDPCVPWVRECNRLAHAQYLDLACLARRRTLSPSRGSIAGIIWLYVEGRPSTHPLLHPTRSLFEVPASADAVHDVLLLAL